MSTCRSHDDPTDTIVTDGTGETNADNCYTAANGKSSKPIILKFTIVT